MTRDEIFYDDLRSISKGLRAAMMPHQASQVLDAVARLQATERLKSAPKHPQDMSLRELFDHVAIVNDAVRAAIAGHPGCEPVNRAEFLLCSSPSSFTEDYGDRRYAEIKQP